MQQMVVVALSQQKVPKHLVTHLLLLMEPDLLEPGIALLTGLMEVTLLQLEVHTQCLQVT